MYRDKEEWSYQKLEQVLLGSPLEQGTQQAKGQVEGYMQLIHPPQQKKSPRHLGETCSLLASFKVYKKKTPSSFF